MEVRRRGLSRVRLEQMVVLRGAAARQVYPIRSCSAVRVVRAR